MRETNMRGKPKMRWSPQEDELISSLRNEGMSWEAIAQEINERRISPVTRTPAACLMRASYLRRRRSEGKLHFTMRNGGGFLVVIEIENQHLRFRTRRTFEEVLAFLKGAEDVKA